MASKESLRETLASRYMIQCRNSKDFECPYFHSCPHEDKDVCLWQLDQSDQLISKVIERVKKVWEEYRESPSLAQFAGKYKIPVVNNWDTEVFLQAIIKELEK